MGISVVINTYNAEKHLVRVLESVKDFDEILICDMYSSDATVEIAMSYGCRVVYHEKKEIVEHARDFAIASASNEWVLVLDADEVVPFSLKEYLYELISQPQCPDALRIPMKNFFMGRFIRADYPSYLLRFFKRDRVKWPPFVHSQPIIDGQIEVISSKRKDLAFIHLSNDSVEMNVRKSNLYSTLEIEKRKNKRYSYLSLIVEPSFRFFKFYVIKLGFLDGRAGFVHAYLKALYKFLTISKVMESQISADDFDKDLIA